MPGLVLNTTASGARISFLPADLDRRFARDYLPDHGDLLAKLIRWVAKDNIPLAVKGAGLLDCHLYQQHGRVILHLVNLTNPGTWRQPIDELIPVGPFQVRLKLPRHLRSTEARLLVSREKVRVTSETGWARFQIKSILEHEMAVIAV